GEYEPQLLQRPRLVLGSKADAAAADWEGTRISAVTGEGIQPLLGRLATLVVEARAAMPAAQGTVVHRPEPEGLHVARGDDGAFVVKGRQAERAVALSDLTDAGALQFA